MSTEEQFQTVQRVAQQFNEGDPTVVDEAHDEISLRDFPSFPDA